MIAQVRVKKTVYGDTIYTTEIGQKKSILLLLSYFNVHII